MCLCIHNCFLPSVDSAFQIRVALAIVVGTSFTKCPSTVLITVSRLKCNTSVLMDMLVCVCESVCVRQMWLTVHGRALRLNVVVSQNGIQGHFSPPKINANTSHLEYLIDSHDAQLQWHLQILVWH